ncbi:IclR family transcriptional regulator [Paenibacillus spongiae]|uniref:IclR family transcriptional regulator n=1 Tax=Paenibacillus spongiae TaxID=2909671 RepID=A0ABY5SKR7_9BACL|nr:IclR family transcriptional regulator [Paenibacillus spongiae]UVI33250.1 IclR family transcriptional regulator [Paenibacillus spongiae]
MTRRVLTKSSKDKVASSTVVKALHVLESLADLCDSSAEGASVSKISQRSGESPSSVCKHLAAFQQYGLVEQDPRSELYRIGIYALRLSSLALKPMSIRETVSPYLRKIADRVGETIHLVIRDGLRVVYIDKVESSKTVRMHSEIGLRNPMYCTGVGKAILAYSPISLVEAVAAEGFTPFTPQTLISRGALLEDLELIRSRGYAIDNCEHESEVRCVAAPILNHLKEPIASFSVSCPKWRLPHERVVEIGEMIRDVSAEISARFGYIGSR